MGTLVEVVSDDVIAYHGAVGIGARIYLRRDGHMLGFLFSEILGKHVTISIYIDVPAMRFGGRPKEVVIGEIRPRNRSRSCSRSVHVAPPVQVYLAVKPVGVTTPFLTRRLRIYQS